MPRLIATGSRALSSRIGATPDSCRELAYRVGIRPGECPFCRFAPRQPRISEVLTGSERHVERLREFKGKNVLRIVGSTGRIPVPPVRVYLEDVVLTPINELKRRG